MKKSKIIIHSVKLSDEDSSQALEYLFKKCTREILNIENMKEVQKLGVMRDDILFCSSRILEGQELQVVGFLKDTLDLESFTGVKFCVPLVSKNRSLAISIALHSHYNVSKHKGVGVDLQAQLSARQDPSGQTAVQGSGKRLYFLRKVEVQVCRAANGALQ